MSNGSADRVRIAYVVPPTPVFAGLERVVHEIADGLARTHGRDLDVHVVWATRFDLDELRDAAYTNHVLDVSRMLLLPWALRRVIVAHRIGLVVSAQVENTVVSWASTRGPGAPHVVAHLHGNPAVERRDGTRRTRWAFRAFSSVVAPRLAAVLTVSAGLRNHVRAELAPRTPVRVTKNPCRDLGHVTRDAPGPRFRFVTVGRLAHQKGIDILLEAVAVARPELPDFEVTVVGDGPDRAALARRRDELGLAAVVDLVGEKADPGPWLRSADCFVLPSRWEGFPLVLLEALATGLPVLASDCDFGPGDLVDDARLGELVPPEDPAALAVGLIRATRRRRDGGDEQRRRAVAARYAPVHAVASHHEALREVLATVRR